MQTRRPPCDRRAAPAAAGFSLIETLIAAALLLLVALGILPLFSNSIINNVQGNLASQVANFARDEAERLYQLPFGHPDLSPDGGATEKTTTSYYSPSQLEWIASADWTGTEKEMFTRTSRVRQFSVQHLNPGAADYEFQDGEALTGSASPDLIHLKEIQVTVQSEPGLGGGKSAVYRVYKSI